MSSLLKLSAVTLMVCVSQAQEELLVKTTSGFVQGHYNPVGVREWQGIRYAKAPVGDLRWEYPVSPDPWADIFSADYNAPGCIQDCNLPPGNCPEYGTSEDCLFLSVWAPTEPSSDPNGYPVFFWIHGGAYEQGLGNCALYNGTNFALKGVITVAINYRLGAFGYMASESMQGNYGIMDQRLALEWTRNNIAGFGGNVDMITIGGQSAGAMSVATHVTAPGSRDLFARAIMQSNPLGLPFHTRDSAKENADSCMIYLNCSIDDVACMRTKTAEEVLDAQKNAPALNLDNLFINFLPWSPLVEENGEIPEQPFYAMMKGNMANIPMLMGSVHDEAQLFVYELFTKPVSEGSYKAIIAGVFGASNYPEIIRKYPFNIVEGSTDGRDAMNVLGTDLLFFCPLRNLTQNFQREVGVKGIPSWIYRFDHVMSFDCWGPDYQFCVGICCHGSELPFVFNVFTDGHLVYEPNADEVTMTGDIGNVWTNFITNADPNNYLAIPIEFPQYYSLKDQVYRIEEPGTQVLDHQRDDFCDMWDRMGFFY